jgi:hypothetical protein
MASITLTIIGRISYLVPSRYWSFTHDVFPFVAAGANKGVFDSFKKKPKMFAGRR